MVTFDVDGSLDVSLNIHGLQVCHSDTSQSIPWQALDECPQTFEVVFGWSMARTMARPIKFWACRKNTKWRTRKQEERACPINPSMRQLLEFLRRGKVISDKYNQTWRETKLWLQLFVLTQLHSPLYSTFPSISLSLSSYTVKPEKQTINSKGHFIAQLADQCTPIMGVSFASGVLPVSFQGPWLSILCGARHNFYVNCFLNRLVHYDALNRTLYECVFQ